MKDPERLIKEFRQAGYKVHAYFMHAPPQEAAERVLERFMRSTKVEDGVVTVWAGSCRPNILWKEVPVTR